jgi:hypothetical protein
VDDALFADERTIDEEIVIAERNAALRTAFAELLPHGQQRARCLERLRPSPAHRIR